MSLILSELGHLLITTLIGIVLYRHYKKWIVFPAVFATGFFLDVDHYFDYLLFYGPHLNLSRFFSTTHFLAPGTVYVPFHAWEYLPLLYLMGKHYKKLRVVCYCLAFGLAGHLLWDQYHNQVELFGYFITYRLLHGFALSSF